MDKSIFIVCHSNGISGSLNTMVDYYSRKNFKVTLLLHPFENYSVLNTTIVYPNGEISVINRMPRSLFNLLEDFALSVFYILKLQPSTVLGATNFDTIPAILCKHVLKRKIKTIIYYPRDYSEERYASRVMNEIYRITERLALKYSDVTISNTVRAQKARLLMQPKIETTLVIPNPVNIRNPVFKPKKINKRHFIYVGDVSKEHGVYEFIREMHQDIDKLVLIGKGTDWHRVRRFALKTNINIETYKSLSHDDVIQYLQKFNGVGIAPYNHSSGWTYYCSPLKISEYIACGIPVITSKVPEIATTLEKYNYGITYNTLDAQEVSNKINEFNYTKFYIRAKEFYSKHNADIQYAKLAQL